MARKLSRLTPRGEQIMSLLLNAVAFGTHANMGNVESLADRLGTTAGRLRPMLRKLADQGYLIVEDGMAENVYPTIEAVRRQNPKLSQREARLILKRLRG